MQCRFAVRNLELAGGAVLAAGFDLMQAPIARVEPIPGPDGTQPVTVGDIIGSIGFGAEERLAPIVAAWHSLIESVSPDVVVTDYAPTANLALFGGPVPWVPVGDGFTLPPHETDRFLPFRTAIPAYDEDRMRAVAARVQARHDRPGPARLPQLFEGDARFVITLPEFDPWRKARSVPAIGPLDPPPKPVEVTPVETYFAYVSASYRFTERVLDGLLACGRPGTVFLRDATAALREDWRRRGLVVWDGPQDLKAMAERAAVIVHHGGVGTAEKVLALGRPQMLVPRHFEQTANARSLGALGVAVALRGGGQFTVDDVGRALAMAADSDVIRARAHERALALTSRRSTALETVGQTCLDLRRTRFTPFGQ